MGDDNKSGDGFDMDRFTYGIIFGPLLGVTLALVLDNWAMLGVGVALGIGGGAAFAAAGSSSDSGEPDDPA
ncbi:hypothetical protein [Nocardioides massiliensis]|uniref:Glycine zipper family protein n=1 Tax=Nocardioides massiliensis TaxID=1325935 RepID=A0ABT9NL06_9ACTN|nr:hypothetical protein [Nocardioides massiliensis]MDP9821088.1 hypothetical protein [Nocardioides massiliensis]